MPAGKNDESVQEDAQKSPVLQHRGFSILLWKVNVHLNKQTVQYSRGPQI